MVSASYQAANEAIYRPDSNPAPSSLRGESLDMPGVHWADACVAQAVVQAAGASLPEFDHLRNHTEPAPVRRAWNLVVGVSLFERAIGPLQVSAAADHLALRRGPCAKLAACGAAVEVSVGLGGGDPLHRPLHAHLALQQHPEEDQRCARIRRQLCAFAALIIGVEEKAARVQPFEQRHTR